MSLYEHSIPQFQKMLGILERWLELAVANAERRKFDPNVFVSARLAPDMFPLARQIGSACDTAKFTPARITGKEAPKHADNEHTLDELRARVRDVIAYLGSYRPEELNGLETKVIAPPSLRGKSIVAKDYVIEMQIPNFYFHVCMAYAILRHNGVELGKTDFIGSLPVRDA
jgi:hypothetical protein